MASTGEEPGEVLETIGAVLASEMGSSVSPAPVASATTPASAVSPTSTACWSGPPCPSAFTASPALASSDSPAVPATVSAAVSVTALARVPLLVPAAAPTRTVSGATSISSRASSGARSTCPLTPTGPNLPTMPVMAPSASRPVALPLTSTGSLAARAPPGCSHATSSRTGLAFSTVAVSSSSDRAPCAVSPRRSGRSSPGTLRSAIETPASMCSLASTTAPVAVMGSTGLICPCGMASAMKNAWSPSASRRPSRSTAPE